MKSIRCANPKCFECAICQDDRLAQYERELAQREAKGRREAVEKVAAKIKEVEALYLEWRTVARALDDNETTRCRGQQAIAIRHVLAEVNSLLSPATEKCEHPVSNRYMIENDTYCGVCERHPPFQKGLSP